MDQTNDASTPRNRLIAGLAQVLEGRSLAELYTDDIVRAAGVSKRTFYQCFANKEACFLALYRENSGRVLAVLKQAAMAEGATALERIRLGAAAYLSFMQDQSALMKRLYIDILQLGTEGMKAKREVLAQFAEVLSQAYDIDRPQGMPPLDPQLVLAIVSGINELILFKIEDGQEDRLSELAGVSERLMLGQLFLNMQEIGAQPGNPS